MKAGDRVRIVSTIFMDDLLQSGCTGVILSGDEICLEVKMDRAPYAEEGDENMWPFYAEELELIQ